MESNDLTSSLEIIASSGLVLSTEHRAALSTSLPLLKHAEKFQSVRFWGKISGLTRDYFVAQGSHGSFNDQKSFYSYDCLTWAQLPVVPSVIAVAALKIRGRFTGSLSAEETVKELYSQDTTVPPVPSEYANVRKSEVQGDGSVVVTTVITEDKRLAAVISTVDNEVAVAPRGAYRKNAAGTIERNLAFEGLSIADSKNIHSYFHARPPVKLTKKSVLEKAKLDKVFDVLDNISEDVPTLSWSLQLERGSHIVLKSLAWPGYVFFHVPQTAKFGYVYNGTGIKNSDLLFMLP